MIQFALRMISLTLLLLPAQLSFSQSTPFSSDDEIRMLTNEISGTGRSNISAFCRDGTVVQAAKDAGLEDVKSAVETKALKLNK